MSRSTVHASDSNCYMSDDDDPTKSPRQGFPCPHSVEDDSGAEGDDDSEEEGDEVVVVTQDQAIWSLDELEILSPFKDEWVESSSAEQGAIVEHAVKDLLALRKQDPGPLRKKVRTWLRRKVKKRKAFGPGKAPPLHTVVAWYKDVELTTRVKEKHGVVPGDKSRFIGLWKTELTAMVNDLKDNPTNKKELKKMEDKRTRWTQKGPPPDRRKWAAEKKAMEMVKNFAYDLYWETGARIVVTVAYRNTKNTICVGQFDWNKFLGQNGQSFVDEHGAEARSFVDKFTEYAEGHLSGNEAEDVEDNSKGKARPKLSNLKPDLTFTRNSKQEALLPHNCLDLKLEDKKHVFRCFLKSQYALAKGASYPGSQCTPPWAKLAEAPDRFFAPEDVPEVDYDDSQKKVILQDPSRMKNQELNACLRLWQDRQKENRTSFQFHHWWSEGQKEFLQAHELTPLDSDEDKERELSENSEETKTSQMKKHRKEKNPGKNRKIKKRSEEKTKRDKSDGAKKEGKTKRAKAVDRSCNIGEGDRETPGHSLQDTASNEVARGLITHGEALLGNSILSEQEPTRPAQTVLSPANAVPPPVLSIPIDPALIGFPTKGPNDHVPQGFHAVPYSMIPFPTTTLTSPGPLNPELPSTGPLTMETMATMMLSLEKRLILQENLRNQIDNGSYSLSLPDRQLTMENPPHGTAIPQTQRKASQQPVQSEDTTGDGNTKATGIDTTNPPKRGRKRKLEHTEPSPAAKKNARKKVKTADSETEMPDKSKGARRRPAATRELVKPRPATRGARKELLDEDDHFRVLRSRRKLP